MSEEFKKEEINGEAAEETKADKKAPHLVFLMSYSAPYLLRYFSFRRMSMLCF